MCLTHILSYVYNAYFREGKKMVTAAGEARITQRDAFYKVQDANTGLYLRLCRPPVTLTDSKRCTWFTTREQAEACVSAILGAAAVDIVRCDA